MDFISLDNASYDQFYDAQLGWIERVLAREETDANMRSVAGRTVLEIANGCGVGPGIRTVATSNSTQRKRFDPISGGRSKSCEVVLNTSEQPSFQRREHDVLR